MDRLRQLLFLGATLALSWLLMQWVHECGHVLGAWVTGGRIQKVIIHPLTISRTDVVPNPSPLVVVWSGPVMGCVLPTIAAAIANRVAGNILSGVATFFCGFCFVANGAYIAVGSLDGVGDAGVMLNAGSPISLLLVFGSASMLAGFIIWHRMGSPRVFLMDPTRIERAHLVSVLLALFIAVCAALGSPRS